MLYIFYFISNEIGAKICILFSPFNLNFLLLKENLYLLFIVEYQSKPVGIYYRKEKLLRGISFVLFFLSMS